MKDRKFPTSRRRPAGSTQGGKVGPGSRKPAPQRSSVGAERPADATDRRRSGPPQPEARLRPDAGERARVVAAPEELEAPPLRTYEGPPRPFHSGLATLTGQPNVGKSTLLNRLVGEKLAIVSPKPQTTRDQIRGIWTTADTQVVFLDTPGIHRAKSPLNRAMVGLAIESLESVDVVVLVVDAQAAARWLARAERRYGPMVPGTAADEAAPATSEAEAEAAEAEDAAEAQDTEGVVALDPHLPPGDRRVIRSILRYNRRWMVALNKIDLVKPRHLLPVMAAYAAAPNVGAIVPISARTGDGVYELVEAIRAQLPAAEALYPPDELTDRSMRFLCAELVREQVFLQTHEEVPYGVAVEVEQWQELPDLTHVQALVHVEKQAQRAILIGKGGARMKAMASAARQQMEKLVGRKVFLEVHVRVEPRWSERLEMLKQFGYVV